MYLAATVTRRPGGEILEGAWISATRMIVAAVSRERAPTGPSYVKTLAIRAGRRGAAAGGRWNVVAVYSTGV
jgi:hypothetical protein